MQEIKYYPLIDCDSAGTEKTPMFFSDDEDTVRQSHEMYLQEIVPQYYRLFGRRHICRKRKSLYYPLSAMRERHDTDLCTCGQISSGTLLLQELP